MLLLLLTVYTAVSAQEDIKTHRVVFQMSTGDVEEQKGLIKNIRNLVKGWGNNFEARVVAHGPGISMLHSGMPLAEEVKSLISEKIVFAACENTMLQKGILREELIDGVLTVPVGIAEIVTLQEQGWVYIKANF